ncbi:MAG: hypothetical protein D6784_17630 [Chloroflexi bacterium]|nr:MAG: hypothetical protein D6784_17630 [Chloroflexota bacterium]
MAEQPCIYRREVPSLAGVAEILQTYADRLAWLYTESEAGVELTAYRSPEAGLTHGRAFGPKLEIRWEQTASGFDLLLLTEIPLNPAGWQVLLDPGSLEAEESTILLWGTHIRHLEHPHYLAGKTGEAWIETRLPRPLKYPVAGSPRWVKAGVVIYRQAGRPILTRLAGVEGGEDEPSVLW